jgi:hypothetical protein
MTKRTTRFLLNDKESDKKGPLSIKPVLTLWRDINVALRSIRHAKGARTISAKALFLSLFHVKTRKIASLPPYFNVKRASLLVSALEPMNTLNCPASVPQVISFR